MQSRFKGIIPLPANVLMNAAFIALLYALAAMTTQLAPVEDLAQTLKIPTNFVSNFISAFALWLLIHYFG